MYEQNLWMIDEQLFFISGFVSFLEIIDGFCLFNGITEHLGKLIARSLAILPPIGQLLKVRIHEYTKEIKKMEGFLELNWVAER